MSHERARPTCAVVALALAMSSFPACASAAPDSTAPDVGGPDAPAIGNANTGSGGEGRLSIAATGAACDGNPQHDDTRALSVALARASYVVLPAGKVCTFTNAVIPSGRTLDGQGASIQAGPGADWVVKVVGWKTTLRDVQVQDSKNYTLASTTLASAASPGAASISVVNASKFAVGNPIAVTLASGVRWLTRIQAVSGDTITLLDPIPASATGCAFASGGSSYASGQAMVVRGGTGAPATVMASKVSSGAAQTCSVLVPGFYASAPEAGAATIAGPGAAYNNGRGATVTLTASGASNGAAVQSAYGAILVDRAKYWKLLNLNIVGVPVGIQIADAGKGTPSSFYTSQGTVQGVGGDDISLVGIFKDVGVSDTVFDNVDLYGSWKAPFGVAGIYSNDENPGTVAPGGNDFSHVRVLQWETGVLARAPQLDTFGPNFISDTNRDYGWVIEGGALGPVASNLLFEGEVGASFTGPSALSGHGSQGIGMWVAPNSAALRSNGIATLTANVIGVVDDGPALRSNDVLVMSAATTAAVPGGVTTQLGPTGATTSGGWAAPYNTCTVLGFRDYSDWAPGAGQQYTVQLYVNGTALGPLSTVSGGSAFGAGYVPAYAVIHVNDNVTLQLVTSYGAHAATHRYSLLIRC